MAIVLAGGIPLPGQAPAIGTNALLVNADDLLRDLPAPAARNRANDCGRLSFSERMYFLRDHPGHFGLSRRTAGGDAHETQRNDALRFQRQHGRCDDTANQLLHIRNALLIVLPILRTQAAW